jgi:hypothetical protein
MFWVWQKDFGKKITFIQKTLEINVDEIDKREGKKIETK